MQASTARLLLLLTSGNVVVPTSPQTPRSRQSLRLPSNNSGNSAPLRSRYVPRLFSSIFLLPVRFDPHRSDRPK